MPEIPFDRRRVLAVGLVALAVLVVAAKVLLRPARPAVPPPVRIAAPAGHASAPRLFVNVVGAVRRPGLYTLKDGSRVADAVIRAGGPTPKAQIELLNLAARIADGEQIVVPRRGLANPGAAASGVGAAAGPVHLNSATLEQLDALPGVGPVTAQKILDYRQQHGAFGSVDELDAIAGIGPARLEQLRGLVAP
ncbi:MAG: helix-hairpin-helix domain-containing protein [Gaiellaceae bacterium]